MREEPSPSLAKAALAYARRGIPVFPCAPRGKTPLTPNGFQDATADLRRVAAWWRRWPAANLGLPTGRRSGLLVLDVDAEEGGFESLAALERSPCGPAPKTTRAGTGGGGAHLYFRYPPARGPAPVRNSAGLLGPGLDVRGEGGYVVAPPSRTAGRYSWLDASPAADPRWLLECLRELTGGQTLF